MTKNTRKIHMTPEELGVIRRQTGRSWADISRELGIKYRTLQDYAAGKRPISAKFATRVREFADADRALMDRIVSNLNSWLDTTFPKEIPAHWSPGR
jgi:predicted transcriptional regulator